MTQLFQNKFRTQPLRLQSWDYSHNAYYFVTICTHNREHLFGEVGDGKMNNTTEKIILEKFWKELP